MNLLNDKLQQLIGNLNEVQTNVLSHEQRKSLLLELHQIKLEARKEQADAITNELVALEYSLGFGQEVENIQIEDIQEHIQRLSELCETGIEDNNQHEEMSDVAQDEHVAEQPEFDEEPERIEPEQLDMIPKAALHLTICNCKSRDEARDIARGLIENRYAACVNFIANIGAIYRWQDNIEDTSECQLQIKSVPRRDEDIKKYIMTHHSYDVPEIITVPVYQANQEYIQWVIQETTS